MCAWTGKIRQCRGSTPRPVETHDPRLVQLHERKSRYINLTHLPFSQSIFSSAYETDIGNFLSDLFLVWPVQQVSITGYVMAATQTVCSL